MKVKTEEIYQSIVLIVLIAIILAVCVLTGCAVQESASTDHHHRIPQISCTEARYEGRIRQICCEGERCWFTN